MTWSGGCLCGKVRYEASETPGWVGHCHCRLCRRHTGAAFATWLWWPVGPPPLPARRRRPRVGVRRLARGMAKTHFP